MSHPPSSGAAPVTPSAGAPLLSVRGVTKTFGGVMANADVSFDLARGEILGLIGPNGAGKTSMFNSISGEVAPDQGEIRLDGARYRDWDAQRLARFIGYLPQDSVLFPGTVKNNISRFEGWPEGDADIDSRAIAAAKAAGAHELILSLPNGYDTVLGPRGLGLSSGQQQIIALARALYGDPVLYVLDEPNSNLDAESEQVLIRTIERLKASGAIVVLATHRISLIGITDYLAVMKDGRLERFGPKAEILQTARPAAPSRPAITVEGERS